jgi:hypothetical protein
VTRQQQQSQLLPRQEVQQPWVYLWTKMLQLSPAAAGKRASPLHNCMVTPAGPVSTAFLMTYRLVTGGGFIVTGPRDVLDMATCDSPPPPPAPNLS